MVKRSTGPALRAWQRMLSGRRLDLLDPSPLDIEIADIAHGLARVARWNGQTEGPHIFSVAQHSVLVEAIFSRQMRAPTESLACLLHDAPEYVIGDMISPFKAMIGPAYHETEARLMTAIHVRFGLPGQMSAALKQAIKRADRVAARHEAVALAGFSTREADSLFGATEPLPRDVAAWLVPLATPQAEAVFLTRFEALQQRMTLAADRTPLAAAPPRDR